MRVLTLVAALLAGAPAMAELITVPTSKSVSEAADALEAAVDGAGAKVFARVDHAAGAASVNMALDDATLLVFGNPKLGTPALQADPRAGLFLPLRVLIYAGEDGGTLITYEDPAAMFDGLEIPGDAEVIAKMTGALGNLTAKAAE